MTELKTKQYIDILGNAGWSGWIPLLTISSMQMEEWTKFEFFFLRPELPYHRLVSIGMRNYRVMHTCIAYCCVSIYYPGGVTQGYPLPGG